MQTYLNDEVAKLQKRVADLEEALRWKAIHYDNLREYTNRLIRENNAPEFRMFKAKLADEKRNELLNY